MTITPEIEDALRTWLEGSDAPDTAAMRAALLLWLGELRGEIEELQEARFQPIGDNHHNAALCPHCGVPLRKALDKIERLQAELTDARTAARESRALRAISVPAEEGK